MAGSDPSGATDIDEVRDNLRAVMLMGLPEDETLRAIFHFPRTRTFDPADNAGQPLDWAQTPTSDSDDDPGEPRTVTSGDGADQVVYALETGGGRGGTQAVETPFGDFDVERLVMTMLDVDRAKIDGFLSVTIGAQTFLPAVETPAVGLFDMVVHQITLQALDAHVNSGA